MREQVPSARRRAMLRVGMAVLVVGANVAACSSSSGNGGIADGGGSDAAVADEMDGAGSDGGVESGADAASGADAEGGGNPDVAVYPDAFSYPSPDGCFLLGASCLDDSTCCSALCVDGGCSRLPVQQ